MGLAWEPAQNQLCHKSDNEASWKYPDVLIDIESSPRPNEAFLVMELLRPASRILLSFALLMGVSLLIGPAAAAQCSTLEKPGTGDSGAMVSGSSARGTFFEADCSGSVYSVSLSITDPGAASSAYLQVYAGQPDEGLLRLLSQDTFVPVAGVNTVPVASQPSLASGEVYTLAVYAADHDLTLEALQGGPRGVVCPSIPVPNTCLEAGQDEVLFSVTLAEPELQMVDVSGDYASDDQTPGGTSRDFGAVVAGEQATRTVTIRNDGTRILTVSDIAFADVTPDAGGAFRVEPSAFWVAVGGSQDVTVFFEPTDGGPMVAEMRIQSDDLDEGETSFHIRGDGLADFGDAPGPDSEAFTGGARHLAVGPTLGTMRDLESDGGGGLGVHSDDDGVRFVVRSRGLTSGITVGIEVHLGNADSAVLQVFGDYGDGVSAGGSNGKFEVGTAHDEHLLTDHVLSRGRNVVSLAIPDAASGSMPLRFRVSSVATALASPIGPAGMVPDGEVEDYEVLVSAAPQLLELDIADAAISLDSDGSSLQVLDALGHVLLDAPFGRIDGSVRLQGTSGGQELTVSGGTLSQLHAAGLEVRFDGTAAHNRIVIEQGVVDRVAHDLTSAQDGEVLLTVGNSEQRVMVYANAEQIWDELSASQRDVRFSPAFPQRLYLAKSIHGSDGDGFSAIAAGGRALEFRNPSEHLGITNSGNAEVDFVIGKLDTPLASGFSRVEVSGGTGSDLFVVAPSQTYDINVAGGLPGLCPPDVLLPRPEGAVSAVLADRVQFDGGERDISHSGIEAFGDTDLKLSLSHDILYATQDFRPDSDNELVLTVTNQGDETAKCATLSADRLFESWLDGFAGEVSKGSLSPAGKWDIGTLAIGESASLKIQGLVVPSTNLEVEIDAAARQDLHEENDLAILELSHGFELPQQAFVNRALFFNKTVTTGQHEAMVMGLFQGSPGIDGAVLCNIPAIVPGSSWPPSTAVNPGSSFRPCAAGLPFPLYVTDLFQDSRGTLWLGAWGHEGLYRSDDQGETWRGVEIENGGNIIYAFAEDAGSPIVYASADNGRVLRSFNDGATWQAISSLPGVSANAPWSLVTHPDQAGVIYAGTLGNGVFVSTDYGYTWRVLDDPTTSAVENDVLVSGRAGHIFDLEFAPDHAGLAGEALFAGTGAGVWRLDLREGEAARVRGTWSLIGPHVSVSGGAVIPEVRSLAFAPDGDTAVENDLVAGTWGFGAYRWADPLSSDANLELGLPGSQVMFVSVSATGLMAAGASDGALALIQIGSDVSATDTEPGSTTIPTQFSLDQNYPNPFNPETTITFSLEQAQHASLRVFDTLGREVAVLADGVLGAGTHRAVFSSQDLPSGSYLYRLSTRSGSVTRLMVLHK